MIDQLNRSLIVITGGWGSGKSIAANTIARPSEVERVYVHDAENSSNRFRQQLRARGTDFGYYLNLDDKWTEALPDDRDLVNRIAHDQLPWTERRTRDSMIDYWRFVLEDINENMTPGKYDVYVHDTIERLEAGMTAFVEANKRITGWSKTAYGEMWTKGVYPLYRGFLNALYQRGVKVVVFTSHLRTPWVDGKPVVGSVEPKGKSILYKLSQLFVWLVKDPRNASKAPAGLIFKERLGTVKIDGDSWAIGGALPPRVPEFTWDNVERYLEEGVDITNLNERERLSESEKRLVSTTLDSMQLRLMVLQAEEELLQKKQQTAPMFLAHGEAASLEATPQEIAVKLYADGDGIGVEAIAEQLGKPAILVQKWINGAV
ncbi:AAA family ATPase [Candidatus Uhrbacteria bacterium]|nr:AAA family ATPase [Candidatus Uhrbacteria bacterium]